MPCYKFYYFDARGRGELCRYVLHAKGVDFEDCRLGGEKWQNFKPSTPFGQMPVLDVDGKKLAQSDAIARFLARELDLAGKTSWEQAECDQYMGLAEDMLKDMGKVFFEKDEAKKAELKKNLNDVIFPKFLAMFESCLDKNGGSYLVGDGLTIADLTVYNIFDTPLLWNPNLLDGFPKLKAQREKIEAIPKLAEYIKNRKPTDV